MEKLALVTGASSGFGEAIAKALAKEGYHLILVARRIDKIEALKNEISKISEVNVKCLALDVTDKEKCQEVLLGLTSLLKNIDVLVNNAGLALGRESIYEANIDDWEKMIDTNIKGLLYFTRIISPYMVQKKSGHIINIGSIAGKETYPNGNVYCATKHAVEAITKGTRQDLLPFGIKVSSICPGAAETEFSKVRYKGNDSIASVVYDGYQPLLAQDIADALIFIVTRPPHVNIYDLIITPTAQADCYFTHKQ